MDFTNLYILTMVAGCAWTKDYCAHEYFNPECREDEVIIMEKAIYGRMEAGKCLKIQIDTFFNSDNKYLGCEASVLEILDDKCSGLQKCRVQIIDPELVKRSICYQELMHYLSAEYSCQPVVRHDRTCSIGLFGTPVQLLIEMKTWNEKNLEKCGYSDNPWMIETSAGQNINVSIMIFERPAANYTHDLRNHAKPSIQYCGSQSDKSIALGKISETSTKTSSMSICTFTGRRKQLFVSKSNKIEIELNSNVEARFLLMFSATGCYDLKPPQDAWMKRDGNEIIVGCYMNRHTWKLVCNGRNWIGVIGNCSQQSQDFMELKEERVLVTEGKSRNVEAVFILVVAVCLATLLSLTTICGLMIFCQRSSYNKKIGNSLLYGRVNIQQGTANANANGDLENFQKKPSENKLEGSYHDPCYFVLEGEKEHKTDQI